MRNRKSINTRVIQAISILAALTFVPHVLAVCVQSDPEAELVFSIDANSGCNSINDHVGCHIKDAEVDGAFCKYGDATTGGFIATSGVNTDDGSLGWEITQLNPDKPVLIDVAVIGGAIKGNNCGYGWKNDVKSGSGGDCKRFSGSTCVDFQNFTSLDVCTDLKSEVLQEAPPVATTLKSCVTQPDGITGELDETGIICPIYTAEDVAAVPNGEISTFKKGDLKPVIVCNFEKDKYAWGTTGANEKGGQEEVCCQCGINMDEAEACFVSDDSEENDANGCARTLTSDPTEDVTITLQKDGVDPCTKIVSGGRVYKVCW